MGLTAYKTKTFPAGHIPAGLRAEHRLRAGVHGVLEVLGGHVVFVDAEGRETPLGVGETIDIPPATPHAIRPSDDASVQITFLRETG